MKLKTSGHHELLRDIEEGLDLEKDLEAEDMEIERLKRAKMAMDMEASYEDGDDE